MKKLILSVLTATALVTGSFNVSAAKAAATIKVYVENQLVTSNAVVSEGTTIVPFVPVLTSFGYSLTYDAKTRTIRAKDSQHTITLTVGSMKAFVDGSPKYMSVAPKIIGGTTYVPLRFLSEVSGRAIESKSGAIFIYSTNTANAAQQTTPVNSGSAARINPNPDFRNISWGMTPAQVKQYEVEPLDHVEDGVLVYKTSNAGMNNDLAYFFQDNKLTNAAYFYTDVYVDPYDYIADHDFIKSQLTAKYGQPDESHEIWTDDLWKDEPRSYWGYALVNADLSFLTEWNTPTTHIVLFLYAKSYRDIKLTLMYESRELYVDDSSSSAGI